MSIDFGRTAQDYSRHRAGFPAAFFERLTAFEVGRVGQWVLDLGTGTGTVARGLAQRGCQVIGLDPSLALLGEAQGLDGQAEVTVEYVNGLAERLSFASTTFEVITAGQCWHWFDRAKVAQEVWRLLVPGGKLVIAHFDWLPLPGNVVAATERLIEDYNPAWSLGGGSGLYPAWLADVALAGFAEIETFSFDCPVIYSHEAWRGRIRASAGVAASLPPQQVSRFDTELGRLLLAQFPQDPLIVPHRVFAVICQKPKNE
jgi:SAM-dependent methyltransferase